MKSRFLLLLLSLATATTTTRAAIIYSGIQNVPIPLDFEGEYLRIDTGTTAGAFPADWSTRPWLNPFFGGVDIGNSPLLRPVITGTDQILNLSLGTTVSSGSNFVLGESGSTTHFGNGPGQFALNTPGYMGVTFRTTTLGPDYYGWIEMQVSNVGPGSIISWAYENVSGASIQVGDIGAVPEPATALVGVACAGLALVRRRRR